MFDILAKLLNEGKAGVDDILILAPTRWKLKKAIRVLNQTFNDLKLGGCPRILVLLQKREKRPKSPQVFVK